MPTLRIENGAPDRAARDVTAIGVAKPRASKPQVPWTL